MLEALRRERPVRGQRYVAPVLGVQHAASVLGRLARHLVICNAVQRAWALDDTGGGGHGPRGVARTLQHAGSRVERVHTGEQACHKGHRREQPKPHLSMCSRAHLYTWTGRRVQHKNKRFSGSAGPRYKRGDTKLLDFDLQRRGDLHE